MSYGIKKAIRLWSDGNFDGGDVMKKQRKSKEKRSTGKKTFVAEAEFKNKVSDLSLLTVAKVPQLGRQHFTTHLSP
jgi:hypothetical protein